MHARLRSRPAAGGLPHQRSGDRRADGYDDGGAARASCVTTRLGYHASRVEPLRVKARPTWHAAAMTKRRAKPRQRGRSDQSRGDGALSDRDRGGDGARRCMRTAFSPNIKERADCSTAIFDAQGEVIALAQRVPMHLGSMVGAVDEIRKALPDGRRFAPATCSSRTIPYNGGGTHLPDINIIAPVFVGDQIVAFVANIAHHADVGGMVPGSRGRGLHVDLSGRDTHSAGAHRERRQARIAICSTSCCSTRARRTSASATSRRSSRRTSSAFEACRRSSSATASREHREHDRRLPRFHRASFRCGDRTACRRASTRPRTSWKATRRTLSQRSSSSSPSAKASSTFDFTGSEKQINASRNIPHNARCSR